ncbi:hypothetical protein K3248_03685 [Candidatus Bartonella raoultii]|uniref:Uncharacterized protein n=1 Tax=Bartonella raoultii TaxID=1457020 RepID=A0ABS7I4Q1_9HYPH|nr:hypothetical protein [Bartonella raoultii]MBX4335700.1 hypothetical protein [Bartonella raoultii]
MILWVKKSSSNKCGSNRFFMVLAKAFTLGKKAEQQKQTEKTLKAATKRLEVENEINQKRDADVRAALSRWLRSK